MAAIFNDVSIEFGGKQHAVKPTFEMINRIEMPRVSGGLGISLAGLTARSSNGDVPVSEVARILAYMLQSVGVNATDEDMYVQVMTSDSPQGYIEAVTMAFFPVLRPAKETGSSSKKK